MPEVLSGFMHDDVWGAFTGLDEMGWDSLPEWDGGFELWTKHFYQKLITEITNALAGRCVFGI